MQREDRIRETIEQKLARARLVLQLYRVDDEGYLLRDGALVTDPTEIAYVKDLIHQVDRMWLIQDAARLSKYDLERGSRFMH